MCIQLNSFRDEEGGDPLPDVLLEEETTPSSPYQLVAAGSNKGNRAMIDIRGYKLLEKNDTSLVIRLITGVIPLSLEVIPLHVYHYR